MQSLSFYLNYIMLKKIVVALIYSAFLMSFAQEEEKVKGNREVVEKRITIPNTYHTLAVDGNFEVYLRKQASLSASIEADGNLLKFIEVVVTDGVLTVTATKTITRAKELKVTLGYNDELAEIVVKDKVKLFGDQPLKGEKLLVEARDFSNVKVDSNTLSSEILLKGKAKFRGILQSKEVNTDQSGTSKIELTVTNSESVNITLHERSSIEVMGESRKSTFLLNGNSYTNAIKLNSVVVSLSNTDDSKVYIKCVDKAVLQLSGKSDTYIMGNPLIQLTRFEDESSLHKTKKEPSSLGRLLK